MKMVVFSDVHGNQYSFHAFQMQMAEEKPDRVFFLGDVFGYYYGQEEILTELRNCAYTCILGNHDQMFLDLMSGKVELDWLCSRYGSSYRRNLGHISSENLNFLAMLNPSKIFECDGLRFGMFHGTPDRPLDGRLYPDTQILLKEAYANFDFVFLGHTHHKMIRKLNGTTIINPGSIGQQRDGKGCSYVTFDTAKRQIEMRVVAYPIQVLISEIREKDGEDKKLLEVLKRRPLGTEQVRS